MCFRKSEKIVFPQLSTSRKENATVGNSLLASPVPTAWQQNASSQLFDVTDGQKSRLSMQRCGLLQSFGQILYLKRSDLVELRCRRIKQLVSLLKLLREFVNYLGEEDMVRSQTRVPRPSIYSLLL